MQLFNRQRVEQAEGMPEFAARQAAIRARMIAELSTLTTDELRQVIADRRR